MKIGAFPIHNLPKVRIRFTASHKPPIMQKDPLPITNHQCHEPPIVQKDPLPMTNHQCQDDVWKSYRALSETAKGLLHG